MVYAVVVHLRLDPAVVFHEEGYRGTSSALIENFQQGRTFGVPMLQWLGMTYDVNRAPSHQVAPYPHMIRWLRPDDVPAQYHTEVECVYPEVIAALVAAPLLLATIGALQGLIDR